MAAKQPLDSVLSTPTISPEYETMCECCPKLVTLIRQSPSMIGNALFARNFLAPNVRNFVNDRMVSETEKAQRLVDTMTDRIQHFPDSFNDFIDVLEKEGPWTSDMVKELRDLCRDKSVSSTAESILPPQSSTKSQRLFDEAMKAGYVSVQIKNVLLFGMAGAGKTSVQNLIFGLPPPDIRSSTPLADAPKRVIRNVSRVKVQAGEGSWNPVTREELEQMVIDSIRSFADESKEVPKDLGTKLKPLSETNVSGKTDDEGVETSSTSGNTAVANDRLSSSFSDEKQRFTNMINEIVDAFVKSVPGGAAIGQLFKKVWVYFTDSGGQPHFHNLLPLFIQGISAALFVLRLCEGLDEHPMVEYYKDGELASKSYPAALTTLDNFKYLVQSLYSRSEDGKLGLVCIGTHLDKVSECSETLEQKNEKLLQLLPQDLLRENVHFYDLGKELIFPVDAKNIVPDREDMARKLCEAIENCPPHEIDVPFWWYTFEIILHKLSGKLDRRVLSREECLEVAHRLNFHEDALTAALEFFHKHHIFHYYPHILPDVVFCDTQVLLDKVTELVEHASFLRDSSSPVSLPGNWLDFKDRGIITLEFIKEFKKHYVANLFQPPELIKIFKDLLILTPLSGSLHGEVDLSSDKVEYFMPSLLDMLPQSDLEGHRVCSSEAAPLLFRFLNGWPRCGVFCCLQVYLIQHCNWELCLDQIKPMQNIVQLQPPDSPCIVTLVDFFSHIELYVDAHDPDCQSEYPSIREQLLDGIKASCEALRYSQDPPDLAFICPCKQPQVEVTSQASSVPDPSAVSGGQEHHVALINKKYMKLKCTKSRRKLFPLETKHKVWLPEPCLSSSLPHEFEKQSKDASCVPQSSSSFTVVVTENNDTAYKVLVSCGEKVVGEFSKDPKGLALSLRGVGFISDDTLDKTNSLNEISRDKARRLYTEVLGKVKCFPHRYAKLVSILEQNRTLYGDLLEELDQTYRKLGVSSTAESILPPQSSTNSEASGSTSSPPPHRESLRPLTFGSSATSSQGPESSYPQTRNQQETEQLFPLLQERAQSLMASQPLGSVLSTSTISPEYETMCECCPKLVTLIRQSPSTIGNALFARNFLAPKMRNFVNDRMVSETEKAQRLVDTMTDRIQHFPYSFNEFVAVLENEGPWTSDFVKELRDLYRAKGGCVVEPSPDQNSEESDCDSKNSDASGSSYGPPPHRENLRSRTVVRDGSSATSSQMPGPSYPQTRHQRGREPYQQKASRDSSEHTFGPKIAGRSPVQSHEQVAQLHDQGKDSTGKIKLSELPYKDFVTQFGDLFTDKFAVKDDIAEAVLSYESDRIQISGVSLGMKKVKIHDKFEVRPSLVALFEKNKKEPQQSGAAVDVDAETRNIPPQADRTKLVKNIIEAVNVRNPIPQSPQYVCEDDPHWLELEFLLPDVFADLAFLGDSPVTKAGNGKWTNPTNELVGSSAGCKSKIPKTRNGGCTLLKTRDILKAREPNEALKPKMTEPCSGGSKPKVSTGLLKLEMSEQNTLKLKTPEQTTETSKSEASISKKDTKVSKTNDIKKILRPGDEFDAETDPDVPPTERRYGGAVGLVMKFNVKSPCGKKCLLYGVTCLHCGIPFNAPGEPPCEAYNNLYSELDERNMIDQRMTPEEKYISVCHGQGLIPDVVEEHLRNIIVYTHTESNAAQTTSEEVGSFRCGLYGHLISSDTPGDHHSRTVSIAKPRIKDPSVVDIALFSLDNDDCERNVCLPKTSTKSWEVYEAENFTSLFEKYELENEQMYIWKTKYKPNMAISAHIVTAGEIRSRQGSTQNFIFLKASGQDFATPGDSGSLLFLKDVMRRTDSPVEVPERVNVAVGILTRGKGYNFCGCFLQPSLDICAFQLYLQQARKLQLSLTDGNQKCALDEYSSLCEAMENGKVTLKKRYKFADLLECSYTPCLNEFGSN